MLRLMRGVAIGVLLALLLGCTAATTATAQPQGYDGHNPFSCTLQQVGTGTDFPFPDADPFCVEFDKTHQNVTELGLVDFMSKEPARVAAAGGKCFYYQRDHWTGSVAEGQSPETYHFDGSYYFDKANGTGGVYVENFRIAGQSGDPTMVPGFPEEWKPYFSSGRGGVQSADSVPADPSCATKSPSPGNGSGPPAAGGGKCRVPGGHIGRGIGGVRVGATRRRARAVFGTPTSKAGRYLAWCLDGGGRIAAVVSRSRVRLMLTDAPAFDTHGLRVGSRRGAARRRLHAERRIGRVGGAGVYAAVERRRKLYVAFRSGRVTWIAVSGKHVRPRVARRWLRRMPV